MSTPEEQIHESTYVLDAENAAEMARLRKQHEMVTRTMGGLLSEQTDLSSVHEVLDLACGPGGWALELAAAYPHIQVTGADTSRNMLDFARSLAVEQGLNNVNFCIQDVLEPFNFPSASFDLVNARYLCGILTPRDWPRVVSEMVRVTRPGGIVRLTEPEMGISNNAAIEEFSYLFTRSMLRSGQSFSPDGRHMGITPMLAGMLRDAGLVDVRLKAHVADTSFGGPDYADALEDGTVFVKLIQPYLIRLGMITQEAADQLYQRFMEGNQSPTLRSLYYMLTAWGKVPA
jgi:ubiquinone/menaquinone biosynthesis C-methylase UbiE